MNHYFRYVLYLIVFIGYSNATAGSYEDFFNAIQRDDAAAVRSLLVRGFDPNTVNPKGVPSLIVAIQEPALNAASALLDSPALQVEVRTAQDESPLMLAALKGYLEVCQKLVERDADVNKPGWTPLHYAATGGHLAVLRLLLDHFAYVDAESPNGSTPLMMAARYGTLDAVKLLIDAGADPEVKNVQGLSAIDFAQLVQRDDVVAAVAAAVRAKTGKGNW